MSYASAAAARQKVLNHLNAQPLGYLPNGLEILTATGLSKIVWQACVKTMVSLGEMEKVGRRRNVRYRALVKETMTAEAMKRKADAAYKATVGARKAIERIGVYTHVPGEYDVPGHVQGRPLRNQEGIGSGRRQVHIGSTL